MKTKREEMKIVWAYDPFQQNKNLNVFGKKIIGTLFDKKDSITVLYVASNLESELTTAYDVPEEERFTLYPEKLISSELQKLKLVNAKIDVITSLKLSLTSMVQSFVRYTKEKKIDLVLIPSNTKTLLPRLIFGSFCETLVHYSECDLLIYHQKTNFSFKAPKKILYAHDFSDKGDKGLERIVEYAKKWNSKIILVHSPIYPGDISLEEFEDNTQEKVSEIAKYLDKNKVSYEIVITKETKFIHKILLNIATKKEVDIVAISAQASRLSALLVGSNTISLLRETKIPALVLKI